MTMQQTQTATIRPLRGDELPAIADLINACSRHLLGVDTTTEEELRNELQTPGFNQETDTAVAEAPDGAICGYVEVWDITDLHVRHHLWPQVHPDHRESDLGMRLLDWAEARARELIPLAPPDAQVVVRGDALRTDTYLQALYAERGYQPIRYFLRMAIDLDGPLPPARLPDGITLRPMRAGEERAIYRTVREAFRDHWGYVEEPFEKAYARWIHFMQIDQGYDPSLWFVALEGEEIAGAAVCKSSVRDDPDMGWVNVLGVRREFRKRGIAQALLQHSFGVFQQRGSKRAGLSVDADSLTGATRLYEKAGMHVDREQIIVEKELRPGREV